MLGASFDTPAENRAFAEAQQFGFRLLSDVDKSIGHLYEVVRGPDEKYPDFPMRIAYLIDPAGVIRIAYQVTDTEGFAAQLFADIEELRRADG